MAAPVPKTTLIVKLKSLDACYPLGVSLLPARIFCNPLGSIVLLRYYEMHSA